MLSDKNGNVTLQMTEFRLRWEILTGLLPFSLILKYQVKTDAVNSPIPIHFLKKITIQRGLPSKLPWELHQWPAETMGFA